MRRAGNARRWADLLPAERYFMSITFDSKFVYIMGISGAYTHEEAKEIAAELLKAVEAAQQSVQADLGTGHVGNPCIYCGQAAGQMQSGECPSR